jgi:hypothetical protein
MKSPNGYEPWVIRTDFSSDESWKQIRDLIAAPQKLSGIDRKFYAYVTYVDDAKLRDKSPRELVHLLPDNYDFDFCFVVDLECLQNSEHPFAVVGFEMHYAGDDDALLNWFPRKPAEAPVDEIITFKTLPCQIQSIENNLSIGNMGFEDFANAVDGDGVFRGFRRHRR